jgi:hypothetical protein
MLALTYIRLSLTYLDITLSHHRYVIAFFNSGAAKPDISIPLGFHRF